jgi:uncharacterized tellurite resistance protein B-like protein
VLLIEVMRADPDIGDAERAAAMAALRGKFALADDEIERLMELATTRRARPTITSASRPGSTARSTPNARRT